MRITFRRFPEHAGAYSLIERDDGAVYAMKESRPGARLPHDLRHFITERELRVDDGIWGGIAAGMVYGSMVHVRGRRTPHAADRSEDLARSQRHRLVRAELLAGLVESVAALDAPSADDIARLTRAKLSVVPPASDPAGAVAALAAPPPDVLARAARAMQVEAARWARLRAGQELVYEWTPRPGPRMARGARAARALRGVPRQREPEPPEPPQRKAGLPRPARPRYIPLR